MNRLGRFAKTAISLAPVMGFALAVTALTGCDFSLEFGHKLRNGVESQDGKVVGYTDAVPEYLNLAGYKAIGAHAFKNCRRLKGVKISEGLTGIGVGAFEGCDNALFNTSKVSGVKLVDGWAVGFTDSISGNIDLTEVRGIADGAFSQCQNLTGVTIGNMVTNIGSGTFANCRRLRNVTIGSGVRRIDGDDFLGCGMLAHFSVAGDNPNYKSVSGMLLTKDGSTLVCGISGDVVIPDGVTRIGAGAFRNYDGLTSVTIPDSVKVIEDGAFGNCGELTRVVVGRGVANIGKGTFLNCRKIESFSISEENPHCKSVSGVLLTKDGKTLICGISRNVAIPDGVTSIAPEAFCNYDELTDVTIPDSVTNIGNLTFADCVNLTRVVIGKGVQDVRKGLFLNCPKIEGFSVSEENPYYKSVSGMLLTKDGKALVCGINGDVVIPDGVTSIAPEAFGNCNGLTSVTIPDSVKTVGDLAFCDCKGLTYVVIGKNAANIGKDTFYNCRKIERFRVSEENPHYKSVSGSLLTKDGKTLIYGVKEADGTGDGQSLTRFPGCLILVSLLAGVVGVAWWVVRRIRKNRAA